MQPTEKIGYARVSTHEQNADNQVIQLLEAGVPRDNLFIDRGVSGTVPPAERPAFKKMLDYLAAHPGRVRCLFVVELSRLGRTMFETIAMVQKIESAGVVIWSLAPNESFTRNEDAALRAIMMVILSWVAERERANLIERTKAGLDRARADGKTLGRPRADIDWGRVADRRAEGAPWTVIARELGMTHTQLYRRRRAAGRL
ncbi:MAG: DNA-invertase hin [Firmicutes bacterium ADurb.Bin506]|nr:MAG: DNA-invertase hin [Firmicutes bacterium ADurb.Bin506]